MSKDASVDEGEIRRLVAQLAEFTTRGRARRQLVMIGKPAVPALVEALGSPIEGAAWSAVKTLDEIGDESAVEALKKALPIPALKDAATEAIRRITGRDPGEQPAAATGGAPAQSAAGLGDKELAQAVSSGDVTAEKGLGGYTFTVRLPNNRKQKVDMILTLKDSDGSRLVALYTECGPASAERYEWALKTNLKTPFGAFAVRDTAQGPRFVMVDAYLRETAGVHQLRRAIETLAKRADALEESITGEDRA